MDKQMTISAFSDELAQVLYLLQNLYDLSDEATVAEAIDSRAFSEFCSVDSSNQVPDSEQDRQLFCESGAAELQGIYVVLQFESEFTMVVDHH